ncbi:MAG: CheY-like chemotaxis protein [Candidatus Omnitrophota bacterium]|jgi:CheY-like chemotaxis protein
MDIKSLRLKIIFAIEAIVGARILLFTIPVIISKKSGDVVFPYSVDDRFVMVITFVSLLYLAVGVVSLMGHKFWRYLHYFTAIVTFILTSFLLKFITERGGDGSFIYYSPVVFALFVTIFAVLIRDKKEKKSWQSILVIDDDEALIKTIRPMLMAEGYSVLTAVTGESGYQVATNEKPDLIILDVILPGIKGRELCKKFKEDAVTKDTPIVFLTSKFSEDDIKAELEAGAVAHLTKPVDSKSLLSMVKNVLQN